MGLILSQFDDDDRAKMSAAVVDMVKGAIHPVAVQVDALSARMVAVEAQMKAIQQRSAVAAAAIDTTRAAIIDLAKIIDATRLTLGWDLQLSEGQLLEPKAELDPLVPTPRQPEATTEPPVERSKRKPKGQ